MAEIILVTGGARSGKSSFTEQQIWDRDKVCYLATGVIKREDEEWQERVRLHQERRPSSWATHEGYAGLGTWLLQQTYETYLLDCATMLTTNVLFDTIAEQFPEKILLEDDNFLTKKEEAVVSQKIEEEWENLLAAIRQIKGQVYIVTNEIGLGIVPETRLGRYFRDELGRVNQRLAKEAGQVYLVICGLAQRLK